MLYLFKQKSRESSLAELLIPHNRPMFYCRHVYYLCMIMGSQKQQQQQQPDIKEEKETLTRLTFENAKDAKTMKHIYSSILFDRSSGTGLTGGCGYIDVAVGREPRFSARAAVAH